MKNKNIQENMEIYQDKWRFLITNNISFSSSHRAIAWQRLHRHMDHFYHGFVVLLVRFGVWQPRSSSTIKVKIKAARKESHTCIEQHDSVQIDVMNYGLKLHSKLIRINCCYFTHRVYKRLFWDHFL